MSFAISNHVDGLGPGCALWHDRVAAGVVTWSWSPRCSFGLKIFKCLNCCRHHVDSLLLPLSDGRLVYSVARWPWCGTNKDACKRLPLWLGAVGSCPALSPQAAHPCPRRTVAKISLRKRRRAQTSSEGHGWSRFSCDCQAIWGQPASSRGSWPQARFWHAASSWRPGWPQAGFASAP